MDWASFLDRMDRRWAGGGLIYCPACGRADCTSSHLHPGDPLRARKLLHLRGDHLGCWANAYCRARRVRPA